MAQKVKVEVKETVQLSECCKAYVSFFETTLVCKSCYKEVE